MAVIPARVKKPRDKPNVERSVKDINTWIISALRDEKFFSLEELNSRIWVKLTEHLNCKYRGYDKTRAERLEEERDYLKKLPDYPYNFGFWKVCTVQFNYHVYVDKMYYSVDYKLVKQTVNVKSTTNKVDIYHDGVIVATHNRLYGHNGQYSTNVEHMPNNHKAFAKWNSQSIRNWANSIGPETYRVIEQNLTRHKVEAQGYKACMAILSWSTKYNSVLLEKVCTIALAATVHVGSKTIKLLIEEEAKKLGLTKTIKQRKVKKTKFSLRGGSSSDSGFMRGKDYFNDITKPES
jgi:hypothetical protein